MPRLLDYVARGSVQQRPDGEATAGAAAPAVPPTAAQPEAPMRVTQGAAAGVAETEAAAVDVALLRRLHASLTAAHERRCVRATGSGSSNHVIGWH